MSDQYLPWWVTSDPAHPANARPVAEPAVVVHEEAPAPEPEPAQVLAPTPASEEIA